MDYVSASQLMFAEMGYQDPGYHDTWGKHAEEIAAARADGTVDLAVNRELLKRAESQAPTIFDSWTLPYMARRSELLQNTVFFLKLDSGVNARAIRCIVSQGVNARFSIAEAVELIRTKDMSSRERFKATFGFDILSRTGGLRDARKARIDLSGFVFGSSPQQIRRGIQAAHRQILKLLPYDPQ